MSFMLSVTYRPFVLSVVMLSVVKLSVIVPNVEAPIKFLPLLDKVGGALE